MTTTSEEVWVDMNLYLINRLRIGTPEYYSQKSKHLSISDLGAAVGHNPRKSIKKLVWELVNANKTVPQLTPHEIENINRVEFGKLIYGQSARLTVSTMGLCVYKADQRLAASSCSFVSDGYYTCLLLVKSMKQIPDELMTACQRGQFSIDHIPQNDYDEMQGLMAITGQAVCDYVIYCSEMGSLFVQKIPFNQSYWETLYTGVKKFFDAYFSNKKS